MVQWTFEYLTITESMAIEPKDIIVDSRPSLTLSAIESKVVARSMVKVIQDILVLVNLRLGGITKKLLINDV